MKSTLKSFASFAETRKQLLAEFEVSDIRELDEEKRTSFLAALLGETEELETEGNAFGAAVKKAKEEGEDEFEVGGETYKVKESVEEAKIDEAKFNIAAEPEKFGDMVKGIIEKQPKRKYLVINGFNSDDNELYGTISDKPIKESVEEAKVEEADVKSAEDFKEYAFAVLKQAHGDDFDEAKAQEVVDCILDKCGDDYGACVGTLLASLG